MSPQLRFYTNPMSRARITRWMLEETGLPYDEVQLEFGTSMKSPEFLAVNPMGKVPALVHDGVAITENAAICLHLADLVPELGLLPPPGTPVMPSRTDFPVCGSRTPSNASARSRWSARVDSIRVIAWASARRSPASSGSSSGSTVMLRQPYQRRRRNASKAQRPANA